MKKPVVILVVIALAVYAYYLFANRQSSVTVPLSAQNNSAESGTATLEEMNGKVKVTVIVTGQPAKSSQPAHIHVGACPNPGAVVYPLTAIASGSSVTTIDTTLKDLEAKGPLAINLHKSAAQSQIYVACGDIVF